MTFTCLITFPLLQLDKVLFKASTNLFQKQITFATTLGFKYPINSTPFLVRFPDPLVLSELGNLTTPFPIDLTPFRKI